MESLLNPLSSKSENFKELRESVKILDKVSVAHAAKSGVVTERVGRKIAYEGTSKDVSNWVETVKGNR